MTYQRIPDIEKIVVDKLNANAAIEGIAGANCASTELAPNAILPKIRVTLSGGSPVVRGWLHAMRVTIEAWADTKEDAYDLFVEAAYVLENQLENALYTEGIVTSFTQDSGMSWSPDPVTKTPRYLASFVAHTHPNI
jgi:hypothetical protein